MNAMKRATNLLVATACVFTICQPAHAYIDAGSGSYLLQILFAGILGGAFAAKTAITNLKLVLARKMNSKGDNSTPHAR